MLYVDVARLAIGTSFLVFASFTDLLWRRAPGVLWPILAGAGLVLLGIEWVASPVRPSVVYVAFVPVFIAVVHVLYRLRLIFGGADAKALMALAVLAPFPILLPTVTRLPSVMPGGFAAFGNALLLFLALPLAYAVSNVARGDLAFPQMFLGYRVPVAGLGARTVWPMERVVEGRVRRSWFPPGVETDLAAEQERLAAAGRSKVWVTPKVPFMLPLAGGFLLAFFVGDLLTAVARTLLGA